MWRSIIIQSIIYFDPVPYYANVNNTLLYKIDLPGNIRALGVGVGGGGGEVAERSESITSWEVASLLKYVLFV